MPFPYPSHPSIPLLHSAELQGGATSTLQSELPAGRGGNKLITYAPPSFAVKSLAGSRAGSSNMAGKKNKRRPTFSGDPICKGKPTTADDGRETIVKQEEPTASASSSYTQALPFPGDGLRHTTLEPPPIPRPTIASKIRDTTVTTGDDGPFLAGGANQ